MFYWNLTAYYETDGSVRLSGPCIVTGNLFSVVVPIAAAHKYFVENALAQDAFPELSKPEREFLISGVSPEGWQELLQEGLRSPTEVASRQPVRAISAPDFSDCG